MTSQDLKDLQYILRHYLELTRVRFKKEPIRKIAERLADKVERELLKP